MVNRWRVTQYMIPPGVEVTRRVYPFRWLAQGQALIHRGQAALLPVRLHCIVGQESRGCRVSTKRASEFRYGFSAGYSAGRYAMQQYPKTYSKWWNAAFNKGYEKGRITRYRETGDWIPPRMEGQQYA